jgi:formate hydrogenlyase subunit 3/multisubunit Na+/H+ antiporter MnhD subunit
MKWGKNKMNIALFVAIPLGFAFISILHKKLAPILLVIASVFILVGLSFVENGETVIGGFNAPYGIHLLMDSYRLTGLYIVNILFLGVVLLNLQKYKQMSSVLLVSLTGLNGLLMTGDLFNLFVFLEISGISAYLITSTNKNPLASFQYLVAGTVGSSLYLFGLILLYSMFGSLNLADLSMQVSALQDKSPVLLPFLLMFLGLGVEVKLLPLNSWVKGILKDANTLSGPMIASVYAAAMSLVFGRILTDLFVFEGRFLVIVSAILLLSIFSGEAIAYQTRKVKEILLYSSVAQAGLVVLLFVSGLASWALFMVMANAISKMILFTVIAEASTDQSDDIDVLRGLFIKNKVIGFSFTVASLSVIGLPIFMGFVVKMKALNYLFGQEMYLAITAILLASVVEGVYFIRLLLHLWTPSEQSFIFNINMRMVLLVFAIVLVVFGVTVGPVEQLKDAIEVGLDAGGARWLI